MMIVLWLGILLGLSLLTIFWKFSTGGQKKITTPVIKKEQAPIWECSKLSPGMAHELLNPLMIIQAYAHLLLKKSRSESEEKEYAKGLLKIISCTERMTQSIEAFRGNHTSGVNSFELEKLIEHVLLFCGQRLKNHGIQIRTYGLQGKRIYGNFLALTEGLQQVFDFAHKLLEHFSEQWIEIESLEQDDHVKCLIRIAAPSAEGFEKEIKEIQDYFERFGVKVDNHRKGYHLTLMITFPIENQTSITKTERPDGPVQSWHKDQQKLNSEVYPHEHGLQ